MGVGVTITGVSVFETVLVTAVVIVGSGIGTNISSVGVGVGVTEIGCTGAVFCDCVVAKTGAAVSAINTTSVPNKYKILFMKYTSYDQYVHLIHY